MKNTFLLILILSFFTGCKKHSTISLSGQNNIVDGLELTFIKTNLQKSFTTVYFLTENTGYLAASDGSIYKTEDGANTWTALNTNTTLPLYDICFLNSNEGYAVGGEDQCGGTGCIPGGAEIIQTTDGGQTWNRSSFVPNDKIEFVSVNFPSNTTGYIVGDGLILSTSDRNVNWNKTILTNLGGVMLDVKFISNKKGLIACTFGKLLKTIDGGINWNVSTPFSTSGSNTLALVNDNLVYAASSYYIMKSFDFGTTWSYLGGSPKDIFKLVFKSENLGYAFGRGDYSGGDFGHNYGSIYYTTDGGISWKGNRKIHDIGMIQSASFPLENVGYAVSGSTIIKIKKQ